MAFEAGDPSLARATALRAEAAVARIQAEDSRDRAIKLRAVAVERPATV